MQKAVEQEREELGHTLKTLQTSYHRSSQLEMLLTRCKRTTARRAEQLDLTRRELVLHMGDDLDGEGEERLEEIAENLQRALQKVTIAEASKQHRIEASPQAVSSDESEEPDPGALTVPQCPPAAHHTSALTLLAELRDELDALYEQQREEHERKVQHESRLHDMQQQISQNINEYGQKREQLSEVKRVHQEAKTQLAQLKGASTLSGLTSEQLSQLGADIGKYSRKVHLATAVRQLRKENGGMQQEGPNCLVCFERPWNCSLSPCGHVLCDKCASRLNICPTCRQKITGRQRLYMAGAPGR